MWFYAVLFLKHVLTTNIMPMLVPSPKKPVTFLITHSIPLISIYSFMSICIWTTMTIYRHQSLAVQFSGTVLTNARTWLMCIACFPVKYITAKERRLLLPVSVCLFVSLFARLLKKCWTDFDEIFWRDRHGPRTKWLHFGGDNDHNPYPGIFKGYV